MKRLATAIAGLTLATCAFAEGGHELPFKFNGAPDNLASVQRGARNFMNYCSGCHGMKHLRYSRLGKDLQISDDLLRDNLMFTSDKIGDHIVSSMPADAAKWFGQQPPDLTVETRIRGADWVYNYLLSFYVDPSRPMGVNNLVLPNASMPDVLWELHGLQGRPVPETAEPHQGEPVAGGAGSHPKGAASVGGEHGGEDHHGSPFVPLGEGALSPDDYRKFVADTVNFMTYAAEPGRAMRMRVGLKVLAYLLVLTVLAYLLKHEWWKDVH